MPVRRISLFLPAAFFCALALGALAPISTLAQNAPTPRALSPDSDSDDDDAQPVAFLGVAITLDAGGKAEVEASYYVPDKPNLPPSEIKRALQSVLGCTLQDFPRLRPVPGTYRG